MPMRVIRSTRVLLAEHWKERHANVWAWILPLAVATCGLVPPR